VSLCDLNFCQRWTKANKRRGAHFECTFIKKETLLILGLLTGRLEWSKCQRQCAHNYIVCCETRMFCLQSSSLYVVYVLVWIWCMFVHCHWRTVLQCERSAHVPGFCVPKHQTCYERVQSGLQRFLLYVVIASYFLTWEPSKCCSTQAIGCTVGKPGPWPLTLDPWLPSHVLRDQLSILV